MVRPRPEDIPANSKPVKANSKHKKAHRYSAKSYADSCTTLRLLCSAAAADSQRGSRDDMKCFMRYGFSSYRSVVIWSGALSEYFCLIRLTIRAASGD